MNPKKTIITVEAIVNASIEAVWKSWTSPEDIIKWNSASDDWHTTKAENDVRTGGKFLFRMEAKDGSEGFDFTGVYHTVKEKELIEYSAEDGSRKVKVSFVEVSGKTKVVESFEAEDVNPIEMQRAGWQAIVDNFKKYTESKK